MKRIVIKNLNKITMNKNFAVIISGCGASDGAEIGEVMMMLLAISSTSNKCTIFAPDIEQMHVVNHLTGDVVPEKRNVLVEAGRISRGNVLALSKYKVEDFDGLIMPGGFGAAKNLSTFILDGAKLNVNAEVEVAIISTYKLHKPIAALCIAPIILAKLINGAKLTLGNDEGIAKIVTELGAVHQITNSAAEYCFDEKNNIYTSPCYMLGDVELKDIYSACNAIMTKLSK